MKWAWIPGVPLMWDLIVTMTASWQKIFSGDPKVGYWSQHAQYVDAKDAGKTAFGAAKNAGQIDAVIRNTFIQGTLSVIFAVLVVIVFAAGVIVALQGHSWRRAPAERRRAGAVANLRTVGNDPDRGREGGAEAMGRAATRARQAGRQISWYWSSLMGDNHYQRYVDSSGAHSSRRAGHVGTGLLAHAP